MSFIFAKAFLFITVQKYWASIVSLYFFFIQYYRYKTMLFVPTPGQKITYIHVLHVHVYTSIRSWKNNNSRKRKLHEQQKQQYFVLLKYCAASKLWGFSSAVTSPVSDRDTCWCFDTGTCRRHKRDVWPHLSCHEAPERPAPLETFPGTCRPQGRREPPGCCSRLSRLNTMQNLSQRARDEMVREIWQGIETAHLVCRPCCQRRSSLGCLVRIWWRTRSGWSRCRAQRIAPVCLWLEPEDYCDPRNPWGFSEELVDGTGAEDERVSGKEKKHTCSTII